MTRIWKVTFGGNFDTHNVAAANFEAAVKRGRQYAERIMRGDKELRNEYDITAVELIAEA